MASKEEILQKAYDIQEAFTEYECSLLYKAMDEYAKQEAAIWKEKAEVYEKALKEINGRSVCYNAIAIAKNAIEQFH